MNIKGLAEFTNFIRQNGLASSHQELSALGICVDEYKRLCNCDTISVKNTKLNQCNSLYMNFIGRIQGYKSLFLSKTKDNTINFYNDSNQRLATISR